MQWRIKKFGKAIKILWVIVFVSACSTPPIRDDEDKTVAEASYHTIYIDRFGQLRDPLDREIFKRTGMTELESERFYIDRIVNRFGKEQDAFNARRKEAGKPQARLELVIFIHGGLNQFGGVTERSDELSALMISEGKYPIFICWDSSFSGNYVDSLIHIRDGRSRPWKSVATSPIVLVGDVGRSALSAPMAWYKEIEDAAEVGTLVPSSREIDFERRFSRLKTNGVDITNPKPWRGVGKKYAFLWNPGKLLVAPFRDGLGTPAWKMMLRRTDLVLSRPNAFQGEIPEAVLIKEKNKSKKIEEFKKAGRQDKIPSKYLRTSYADTAASQFIRKVANAQKDKDEKIGSAPVTLIGHSMGSIIANNIIARNSDLKINDLVYMGAAAKIRDLEAYVIPWLKANPSSQFYNLSLDPYNELAETPDYSFGFIPHGSLLNWIDTVFGEVNSFKDLTAGSWWNVGIAGEDIFGQDVGINERVHLTRFAIDRKNEGYGPQKHGDFSKSCFWRHSFWKGTESYKPSDAFKKLEDCSKVKDES